MGKAGKNTGRSRGIRIGAAVFLLALCARGLYLFDSSDNPTFRAPIVDSMTYHKLARGLAEGEGMGPRFFWQQFFYPLFLSAIYFFTGSSIVWARAIGLLLGCFTCVLTYRLAERIFGRAAGILAGCMLAVYGPLIFFEGELLAAGWAAFWAAVLIYLFVSAAEKKDNRLCLLLGLCGGLSVITRPNFIPFFVASCGWLILVWVRGRIGFRKVQLGAAGVIAGFLIVTVPVVGQNYRVTGRFSFLPGTGGLNLYIGNNPDFEAVSLRPGLQWQKVADLPLKEGLHTAAGQQSFFYAKTRQYLRRQPLSFLQGIGRKGLEFTSSREVPGNINVYFFRKWSPLLGVLTWKVGGFGFPFGALLPLALLGMLLCWRKIPAPVMLFVVLYPLSVILTHIEARYRMPVIVPLCVLAGGGLIRIAEMVRASRWRSAAAAGVFGAAVALLCSVAGPFYAEREVNYEAELYCGLAGAFEAAGRADDAIESYAKAVGLKGDYLDAHYNMALLLMKQKRVDEALVHCRAALQLDPENADFHRDLGIALFMKGQVDDAVGHYEKALEIDPRNAVAHGYLGLALQSRGKLDSAVSHYRQALELNPEDAEMWYNLGIAFQLQGELDEAIKQYTEALRLNPDFVNAHSNLGVIYARRGRFDNAIAHFTEALKIEPDSAELHCNLGLALESQGRLDEARESYRQALTLQPDHKRARQALEKLTRQGP